MLIGATSGADMMVAVLTVAIFVLSVIHAARDHLRDWQEKKTAKEAEGWLQARSDDNG